MEGVRSLDRLYEFYRRPEFAHLGGPAMVRFLDAVGGLFADKVVYFSTSLNNLWVSKAATWQEAQNQPGVRVWSDGHRYYFEYYEAWEDGPLRRSRQEGICCDLDQARAALSEMLARLKPAPAGGPLQG